MIIRQGSRPQDHFTSVPNAIARDESLTWKARGLFLYLASNVDGWSISLERLAAMSADGVAATRSGVNELIKYGYLVRSDQQVHGKGGAFGGFEYTLNYEPSCENRTKALTSADVDSPSCGNRTKDHAKTARDLHAEIEGHKKNTSLEDQEEEKGGSPRATTSLAAAAVDTPTPSSLPAPEPPPADSGPSPFCERHPDGADHPCGPCADARRAFKAWEAERERAEKARIAADAHARAEAKRQAASACSLCDDDGYIGTWVCDHVPNRAEVNARGMARVRAALSKNAAKPQTCDV